MSGLNKVMIIGNLGRDPEIRYSQNGAAITNFSIATSEQWNDKTTGERQEKTEWHRIVVFGKQAEVCEKYLKKGSQIYVEGRLQTRQWEKDGQTHYTTEIVVANFQFLNKSQTGNQQNQGYQNQSQGNQPQNQSQSQGFSPRQAIPNSDIPF